MSKPTLGGSLIVRDNFKFDYCAIEAIECLLEFCDKVAVVDGGSSDQTVEAIQKIAQRNPKLMFMALDAKVWDNIEGQEKLSYISNIAHGMLDTDYFFYLQADEILIPESYPYIREAIETGANGFLVSRINLWGNSTTELVVPDNRQPCSRIIVRLAKKGAQSYSDAESLAVDYPSPDWLGKITILHLGFVRKREVMKSKIINMQCNVFGMADYDPKLQGMEVFDSTQWFSGDDLRPLKIPLPPIIKSWCEERM